MKLDRHALVRLRPTGLLLLSCVAIGTGAVNFSLRLAGVEKAANRQALEQHRHFQSRLAQADAEGAGLRENLERYRRIVEQGHLGPERRLEWTERIEQIKAARRLLDLRYELAPQQPLRTAGMAVDGDTGGIEFMTSTMKLHLQLLHEEDLFGFLDDLTQTVPALLHVRECSMERLAERETASGLAANLKADCTIDWITLREKT